MGSPNCRRRFYRIRDFFGLTLVIVLFATAARAALLFPHAFSPQEGLTKPVEQPWRQEICLNGTWQFQPAPLPANYDLKNGAPILPAAKDQAWSPTPIRIPSPWNVNGTSWADTGDNFPSY